MRRITRPRDREAFAAAWLDESLSVIEVAIRFKSSLTALRNLASDMRLGPKRVKACGAALGYEPTPEEIERECERIRTTWPEERYSGMAYEE